MEDLQARREARRRKILENSEDRLKKITNIDSDDYTVKSEEVQTTSTLQNEHVKRHVSLKPESEPMTKPMVEQKLSDGLRTIYENPLPDDNVSTSELEFVNFRSKTAVLRNWIVIILALIVRYLYLVSTQYLLIDHAITAVPYHLNKIFLPFFLYQSAEYMFFRPNIPQTGLLNVLFMINLGIRPEKIQKVINLFRVILQIFQNLLIYFFTFVCFDQGIALILQEW